MPDVLYWSSPQQSLESGQLGWQPKSSYPCGHHSSTTPRLLVAQSVTTTAMAVASRTNPTITIFYASPFALSLSLIYIAAHEPNIATTTANFATISTVEIKISIIILLILLVWQCKGITSFWQLLSNKKFSQNFLLNHSKSRLLQKISTLNFWFSKFFVSLWPNYEKCKRLWDFYYG